MIKIKCIFTTILCIMLSFLAYQPCEFVAADEIEGTIIIKSHVKDKNNNTLWLKNDRFHLYKVADHNDSDWQLCEEFKINLTLSQNMTATQAREAARDLSLYALEQQTVPDQIGITDVSGELIFNGLSSGLYLFIQEDPLKIDDAAYICDPFLIVVPMDYKNDIYVEPKYGWLHPVDNRIPDIDKGVTLEVETSDHTNEIGWLRLLSLSIVVLYLSHAIEQKKRKNERADI